MLANTPYHGDCRPSKSLVSEWMMAIRRDACITPGQSELCPTPRCRHQASRGTPRSPSGQRHGTHPHGAVARRPWDGTPSHLTSVLISGRTDPSSRTPGKRASRPLALSWYCETRPCSSLLEKLGVHAACKLRHLGKNPRQLWTEIRRSIALPADRFGKRISLTRVLGTVSIDSTDISICSRDVAQPPHFSAGVQLMELAGKRPCQRPLRIHPQRRREVTGGSAALPRRAYRPPPSPPNTIYHVERSPPGILRCLFRHASWCLPTSVRRSQPSAKLLLPYKCTQFS